MGDAQRRLNDVVAPDFEFEVLGHAALAVRKGATSLLVDPWLVGSCYWRSWWHYPPTAEPTTELLSPGFLFLTHHHFDHFHYPTMRRIDRRTQVVIPKFGVDVMAGELRGLGFTGVTELPHGEVMELGDGLRIACFQYGFDDTALLVSDGNHVIADFNDCKVRGGSLRQIRNMFGPITFLLKNHSWAMAYPGRYHSDDPADLSLLSRDDYTADFLETVRDLRPRYAIPFASMVCFLHPETFDLNEDVITPRELGDAFERSGVTHTEFVEMAPGDRWSATEGFDRTEVDFYTDRFERLDEMRRAVAPIVERSREQEEQRRPTYERFEAHFSNFLRALPPGASRLVSHPIAFEVPSDDRPWWTVDIRRRTVQRRSEPPTDAGSLVRIPEGVLAQAVDDRLFGMVHISMRIDVTVANGTIGNDFLFWGLHSLWEIGYLPVHGVLNFRTAATAWRRRREAFDVARRLIGRGPLSKRLVSNLMSEHITDTAPR
jgi:UDP-MurNAc hydroxylase